MTAFEISVLDFIQTLRTPLMDRFMSAFTHLGDAGIFWIVFTLVLIAIPVTRKMGSVLAIALVYDLFICNIILKNLFARPRPFFENPDITLLIKTPSEYSFPSGHAATAFTIFFGILFFKEGKKLLGLEIFVLIMGIVLSYSRLYLYVHFPTDIIGGIFIGLLCGFLGNKTVELITQRSALSYVHYTNRQ
ncbi:MAG: phosphatase PAP2 family protein [Lachnospiraceae bacterium]|nr:phosphatase PAP2 family protein [Lachnospiraceae bacterium]